MKTTAYEQVTRTMVLNMQRDISHIDVKIDELSDKVTDLFNHQSSRLPLWATIIMTFMFSLATGLIVAMVR